MGTCTSTESTGENVAATRHGVPAGARTLAAIATQALKGYFDFEFGK